MKNSEIKNIKNKLQKMFENDVRHDEPTIVSKRFKENRFSMVYTVITRVQDDLIVFQYSYDFEVEDYQVSIFTLYPNTVIDVVKYFKEILY